MIRHFEHIVCFTALCGLLILPTSLSAQEMTREERIKMLEKLKMDDEKIERNTAGMISRSAALDIDEFELPPLSVFLDAVVENATVKRAQSLVEQSQNEYKLQKRDWLNYIRLNGMYSYGRYNVVGNSSDEYTPMYQTTMTNAQHTFNVGVNVIVGIGDIVNRPLRLKKHKYNIEQLKHTQEEVTEERRLRILEAYNSVTEQLATIRAKAETAALYNAQMKISENNFMQGSIDIITLSLERARRSAAVTNYEQSRVALHNSITLLEMLSNVKIIKEK